MSQPLTPKKRVEIMEFVLADRTGKGFSGDLGYASINELMVECMQMSGKEFSRKMCEHILEQLIKEGKAEHDGHGGYAGVPVQCVLCNNDPCTCGVGEWR